ncbi:MAG: insulinase family protein [Pseudomonadales bacterium]|nr:insulinase family protein [Pseudomonadales bacterium]
MSQLSSAADTAAVDTQQPALHPAFTCHRREAIPSLNITIEEYEHKETGAMHYHLASDNPENVFLVAFRTVPMDSTGVAHILEHTALCGSEKFPVRDPFFMMIRRSLNTFMNAFTSSDWTAYPFASKNRKDFQNLLQVYLDAAFFSRLHELDFAQEGHRLEFAEADNADSELLYKGVVYNEMKGAMSSPNATLWQMMTKHLFPTTTYHYNSGGEPTDIPDLAYQQLLDFYKSHYHPSNAVFMTFGDISAFEHHQEFESLALERFKHLDVNIHVENEKRYPTPVKVEENYAVAETAESKTHIVVGWLLGKSTEIVELFEAQLLTSVLMENSASPLLNILETSELGQSPSPMCGLEDSNREMAFMAGLEGCSDDATEAVEALILNCLETLCKDGVAQEQVEAALHQLELNQREISGDSYPYGLQLILSGLSTALHRGDPIKLMDIDPVLELLRERVADPDYIPGLIKRLLIDNPHRVTLTLKPDLHLADAEQEAEQTKLATIKASLSENDRNAIVEQALALADRQSQEDDPDLLPKVGLEDVPAEITEPPREDSHLGGAGPQVSFYEQGTNGLSYQQIVLPLPALSAAELEVLPLYTSCLAEFGLGQKSYTEVQTWQSQISGGVNVFSSIRSAQDDEQQLNGFLTFSSKSLALNHGALTELIQATVADVRFDESQRLAELVEQICARKEASITGQGHSLAMNVACSKMSPGALLTHQFGGLEGIRRLKAQRTALTEQSVRSDLLERMQKLHATLLANPKRFLLIGEAERHDAMINDLAECWGEASSSAAASSFSLDPVREQVVEGWSTATQVHFCAKAYPTVCSDHPDNAVLQVLAGFLHNGFLHTAIREKGGAYGGGASQDANSASFRFFSYRDPRLTETLSDFDRSIDWLLNGKHQDNQLEEAVLGVIAAMDKSSSPAGEAKQAFYNHLFERSIEQRMAFRQRVLATTMADLQRVASTYFQQGQESIGIVSNRQALEEAQIDGLNIVNI